MLMCPAGFIFGTSADDDPALGPVGPYLQNDYSIIPMQIIPEENKELVCSLAMKDSSASSEERKQAVLQFKTTSDSAVISAAACVRVNIL